MALADLAFAVVAFVGLAVGGRLLTLWARTGQLPELVFGCATLSQALSGIGFSLLPGLLPLHLVWAGAATSLLLEAVGTVAVCLGCWLIFRRGEAWARAAALGLGLVVLALTAVRLGISHPSQASAASPLGHGGGELALAQALTNGGVAAAYGWLAAEAIRYGLLMRRRLALGLDSPLVVHQFLLWGLAGAAIVTINLVVMGVVAATGRSAEASVAAYGAMALIGMLGAAALWGAFFTPRFYRAWVLGRAEATG